MIEIRRYEEKDKKEAMAIWNAMVHEGIAFPQDEELTDDTADEFFMSQSYTGIDVGSVAPQGPHEGRPLRIYYSTLY
ncbi:MAG: hypothetical protein IJV20_09045 [Prevotella sp.]|nr:hypothetical protein [Prevotella sp.]